MAKSEEWGGAKGGLAAGRATGLRERRGVAKAGATTALQADNDSRRNQMKSFLTGPNSANRRKALGRVYKLLTDTPADATGMVDDTPFTKTGVRALVAQLNTRAEKDDEPGARVSKTVLRLFTAEGENESTKPVERVHGMSVLRLQQFSRLATALKDRGKA